MNIPHFKIRLLGETECFEVEADSQLAAAVTVLQKHRPRAPPETEVVVQVAGRWLSEDWTECGYMILSFSPRTVGTTELTWGLSTLPRLQPKKNQPQITLSRLRYGAIALALPEPITYKAVREQLPFVLNGITALQSTDDLGSKEVNQRVEDDLQTLQAKADRLRQRLDKIVVQSCTTSGLVKIHITRNERFEILGVPKKQADAIFTHVARALARIDVPEIPFQIDIYSPQAEGSFDLAIAVGILVALHRLPAERVADTIVVVGNLSLNGLVQPVHQLADMLHAMFHRGIRHAILPGCQALELPVTLPMSLRAIWRIEDLCT